MGELFTRAEAVAALGLRSAKALDRLIEKGAPKPRPGKRGSARYDVEAIKKWREERQARVAPTLDLQAERARLARAQRRLTILKIRQLRGALIPRDAVVLLDAKRQASVRSAVLRLPTEALQRGVPAEHEALLRELAENVLTTLATTKWAEVPKDA
jgi:phage terminase Nu1 subunit (DNA packaging protein)